MLETPERTYVPEQTIPRRTSVTPRRRLRRDFDEDFAEDSVAEAEDAGSSKTRRVAAKGVKVRWRGLEVPKTLWGRIAAGAVVVTALGVCVGSVMAVRGMLLRDDRFVVPDSAAVEVTGNHHVTQAQLLSVFGEDVGRNIFTVSLTERQAQLERLPWVQHATVMRLLPDHLRVSVVERTPVAFVRQGAQIGMVDANGVLLDMRSDGGDTMHYSFPVVSGIRAEDPLSVRAARMKLYRQFTTALDSSGEKNSEQLSEVDLSNPEDVKALIPDKPADILVHFGDTEFLERLHKYQAHLAEWRAQYPHLASVDMRYDRQAVLQMKPGSDSSAAPAAPEAKPVDVAATKPTSAAKPNAPNTTVAGAHPAKPATAHGVAGKPAVRDNKSAPAKAAAAKPVATAPAATTPAQSAAGSSNVSHWVTPSSTPSKGKAAHPADKKAAAKPHAAGVKGTPAKRKTTPVLKQGAL